MDLKKLTMPCCFSDDHECLNHVPATVKFCGSVFLQCPPDSVAYELGRPVTHSHMAMLVDDHGPLIARLIMLGFKWNALSCMQIDT